MKLDGSARKYCAALGQTIAVRDVPAGGGAGTLSYLLHTISAARLCCHACSFRPGQRHIAGVSAWAFSISIVRAYRVLEERRSGLSSPIAVLQCASP